jgi:nicotinamidase-related amidase
MPPLDPRASALLVIDVQKAFDEMAAAGARRNNPDAERRIADVLAAFRSCGAPVIHIRHSSREKNSPLRPERPGYAVQDFTRERDGETVLVKHVNSGFIGTGLEALLRERGIDTVVIVGATTNHCIETTTRMAGNLGFNALLVRDACWTFDRTGPDGELHRAEDIHQMTLSNLSEEFATIVTATDIAAALSRKAA